MRDLEGRCRGRGGDRGTSRDRRRWGRDRRGQRQRRCRQRHRRRFRSHDGGASLVGDRRWRKGALRRLRGPARGRASGGRGPVHERRRASGRRSPRSRVGCALRRGAQVSVREPGLSCSGQRAGAGVCRLRFQRNRGWARFTAPPPFERTAGQQDSHQGCRGDRQRGDPPRPASGNGLRRRAWQRACTVSRPARRTRDGPGRRRRVLRARRRGRDRSGHGCFTGLRARRGRSLRLDPVSLPPRHRVRPGRLHVRCRRGWCQLG